jgi:hypothetical protein
MRDRKRLIPIGMGDAGVMSGSISSLVVPTVDAGLVHSTHALHNFDLLLWLQNLHKEDL